MSDQLDVLKTVVVQLDASGIPYMVTGSLAASHYATPRFTRDIDLVVELDRPTAYRLAKSLASEFYVDEEALGSVRCRQVKPTRQLQSTRCFTGG